MVGSYKYMHHEDMEKCKFQGKETHKFSLLHTKHIQWNLYII